MIESRLVGIVTVFQIRGKLTSTEGLRRATFAALDSGSPFIVLNLQEVSAIDSSGVADLVFCQKTVNTRGGRLAISNPSLKVTNVLAITDLLTVFTICDTEAEAIASVQST